MLLGGLMERSLANSPNIVWGAREEIEMKKQRAIWSYTMVNNQKFNSKEQRENSKATEQYVSCTLLFWHFSESSKVMGDAETNLYAFLTELCLASYVTSGDHYHLHKDYPSAEKLVCDLPTPT